MVISLMNQFITTSLLKEFMIKTNCFGKILQQLLKRFGSNVWYSKLHHLRKKQRILGVLEPITTFHKNRHRYSEI